MAKADIKLDDVIDQTEPMRKLEIKFQELFERRMILCNSSAENAAQIKLIEKDLENIRKAKKAELSA